MGLGQIPALLKETASEVMDDDVLSLSAAVAYYAVFSLPPLLAVIMGIAGAVFGADAVREALLGQTSGLAGGDAATAIQGMIENSGETGTSVWARIGSVLALVVGATGAFVQMQVALNRAWDVKPGEQRSGIVGLVTKRLLTFGMVLTIAFLLLISLALSAAVAAVGDTLLAWAPNLVMESVNFVVSFGVTTLLFAALFVVLPDTRIAWRDVWIGAAFTAALFAVGKTLIGLYVGSTDPGSAFGAAGALALILVWIYYSAVIVLVGAEFTQVYARAHGSRSAPPEDPPDAPRGGQAIRPLPIRT